MSHTTERAQKDCLNCGAVVQGPYCHICGQHNIETKETLWGLIQHFVYDITHFDGKFFSSLKSLLLRPGFLSYEYMRGRRASYLNPVRMYIFTAALFFVVLFAMRKDSQPLEIGNADYAVRRAGLMRALDTTNASENRDSILHKIARLDTAQVIGETFAYTRVDTTLNDSVRTAIRSGLSDSVGRGTAPFDFDRFPESIELYKRQQDSLTVDKRDGWLKRYITRKAIHINTKYRGRKKEFVSDFSDRFLHSLPTMMFISMPLVAAFLMLLYVRRRRQFYFSSHAILVIHVYIAIYILLMIMFGLGWLRTLPNLGFLKYFNIALGFYIFYYGFRSMRVFYGQEFGKTLLKFLLLGVFLLVLMSLLSVVFVANTFMNL